MKKIQVPEKENLDSKSQEIIEALNKKLGMIPNLYATIGYSSNALGSFLEFSENVSTGSLNNKEIEAIKLAVSEANDCDYCRAAHTAIAKMNGFSEEETVELRRLSIQDLKLQALTKLASQIANKAGHVSEEDKSFFFQQGYDEKSLIDVVAVVVSVTFTNYVYGLTQVPIDFPEAKRV